MLLDPEKHRAVDGVTPEQVAKMQKEMEGLQKELKSVEESHGTEALNLVLARGYLTKIFANGRITRYLGQHHADLFGELQNMLAGASDNS